MLKVWSWLSLPQLVAHGESCCCGCLSLLPPKPGCTLDLHPADKGASQCQKEKSRWHRDAISAMSGAQWVSATLAEAGIQRERDQMWVGNHNSPLLHPTKKGNS